MWVREWEKAEAKSHHYHYALFLDGDVVNKSLPPEHIVAYIKFDNLTIKCTKKLY